MTENQLKEEYVALSLNNENPSSRYFTGKILKVADAEEGSIALLQGYLDNAVIRTHFPLLTDLLSDGFYTPVKLFLNGGQVEILEEAKAIKNIENLNHDFSLDTTAYLLSENLDDEASTLEVITTDDQVNAYYIEFWKSATEGIFGTLSKDAIKEKIQNYNLPQTFTYKPKGLIFVLIFFTALGIFILNIFFKEGMTDLKTLGMSVLMFSLSGLSLFVYLKPTKVTLTQEGIHIEPMRNPRTVLWSDIASIDMLTNKLIAYQPSKSSPQKNVWGGYVIPLDNRDMKKRLQMLQELHYFYTEVEG